MTATILQFPRPRQKPAVHRCTECGSHFLPRYPTHRVCGPCWNWARAGRLLAAAARALREAG